MSDASPIALTAAGISIFGVTTGLQPELLFAGAAGGWWSLSFQPDLSVFARANNILIASLAGAWGAPWIVHLLGDAPRYEVAIFPTAGVLGLLSVVVLGPGLISLGKRWFSGHQ